MPNRRRRPSKLPKQVSTTWTESNSDEQILNSITRQDFDEYLSVHNQIKNHANDEKRSRKLHKTPETPKTSPEIKKEEEIVEEKEEIRIEDKNQDADEESAKAEESEADESDSEMEFSFPVPEDFVFDSK